MYCRAFVLPGSPNVIKPHGSFVVGSLEAIVNDTGSKFFGSILLFTKPSAAGNVTVFPRLAGEAAAVKSPDSMAAFGIQFCTLDGSWWLIVSWNPPKKNSLFFTMGPPTVPPN